MYYAFADFEVSDRSVSRMVNTGVSDKIVGEVAPGFAAFAYNAGYTEKGECSGRRAYFNVDGHSFRILLGASADKSVAAAYCIGADNAALMFQGASPVPAGWDHI